jgi:glycosyltransferase involved in cell wall biosynthesis
MRIAVLNTKVPFVYGGAEMLANNLNNQLTNRGHNVDIINIPFKWYPNDSLRNSINICHNTDLSGICGLETDLLISLKFPVYFVKHKNHVVWLCHQHRQFYDMWDSQNEEFRNNEQNIKLRNLVHTADNMVLNNVKKIYTISKNVSQRLSKFNNIESTVLYPPSHHLEHNRSITYEDFIFVPSRINPSKRQHLIIESLLHSSAELKVVICGPIDDINYYNLLNEKIKSSNLSEKVLILGEVDSSVISEYYAKCLCVVFIPKDEDYGLVTIESLFYKKPVITTFDSGGPLEFISHGYNGLITQARSESIARSIDEISNKIYTKELGINAYKKYNDLNLNWDFVIDNLIS